MTHPFDARPIVVAIAGPNGAGKSTFYEVHMRSAGLRFVNADELARETGIDAYEAARLADNVRRQLLASRESFVFETVFSDPTGEKLSFLHEATDAGYTVVLCYIGLESADLSDQRVAMRVMQGGHDVPPDKIKERFPRTLENLGRALRELPFVLVFDNSDLRTPYRKVLELHEGKLVFESAPLPSWLVQPVR